VGLNAFNEQLQPLIELVMYMSQRTRHFRTSSTPDRFVPRWKNDSPSIGPPRGKSTHTNSAAQKNEED